MRAKNHVYLDMNTHLNLPRSKWRLVERLLALLFCINLILNKYLKKVILNFQEVGHAEE